MATEEYSAKVSVDTSGAQKNLNDLKASAEALNKQLKDGAISQGDYDKAIKTNSQAQGAAVKVVSDAQNSAAKVAQTNSVTALNNTKKETAALESKAKVANIESRTASANASAARADALAQLRLNQQMTKSNVGAYKPLAPSADPAYQTYIKNVVKQDQAVVDARVKANAEGYARQYAAATQNDKAIAQASRSFNKQLDADHTKAIQMDNSLTQQKIVNQNKVYAEYMRVQNATTKAANTDANPGVSQKINSAANPNLGLNDKDLNSLSYSLFNVAQSVGVVGVALTGASAAAVGFGINYEAAFSQVERTNPDATTTQVNDLKDALIDLSSSMPTSFTALTGIAALGSQLGIANEDLAAFSDTTAQYATVTGISTDSAAQGFGSLFELLNVGAGDFEKLASSVNYVGVNSVATDQEILNLATSIGASTTQAGFLASETVGLAGALASLRIQPEQARGVILRLFSDFDSAVSSGGKALTGYASILGTTTEATAKLYKSDPSEFFNQLLKGLSTADDLNGALTALGITETREKNVLQRLAGNYDTYTKSMQDANEAYGEGTFLSKSYATVAKTTASQIAVLVNQIQNLLAKAGESVLPYLAPILEFIKVLVGAINLVPAPVLGLVTVIAGLVGIFALVVAGGLVFVATAGLAGNAMSQLAARGGVAGGVLAGLRSVVTQFTGALGINTAAARINSVTLGTIGNAARGAALGIAGKTVATEADTVATVGATVATNGFKTALAGVPLVNIIAGLSVLIPLVAGFASAQGQASEEAKKASAALAQAGGGIDAYRAALDKDTAAADGVAKGQTTIKVAVSAAAKEAEAAGKSHDKLVNSLTVATGATEDADNKTKSLTGSLQSETLVVAKNAKAWVANALAKKAAGDENDPLSKVFNDPQQKAAYENLGLDFSKALSSGFGKDNGVTKAIDAQLKNAKAALAVQRANAANGVISGEDLAGYEKLIQNLEKAAAAADGLNGQLQAQQSIQAGLGADADNTTSATEKGTAAVADLSDQVGDLFSAASSASGYTTALNSLHEAIDENGFAFDSLSAGGIANVDALGTALQAATAYGSTLGVAPADSMAQALASIGGSTDQIIALMQSLKASSPEIYASLNIDDVIAKYKQISQLGVGIGADSGNALAVQANQAELKRLEASRASIASQLKSQQATASRQAGNKKTGKTDAEIAAENAKKIRDSLKTAAEYASDIGSAMKEAFDKKFGVSQAADEITNKFNDIKDRIKEAKQQVREFQATLRQLASDRDILNIQLKVATQYGDTTRATAIKADLGTNKADTASTQGQLKTAQDAASTSLQGNTKAAIANRAAIEDLVLAYQDQITAFAATGASAAQIAAYTDKLKAKFEKQVTQLGYNRGAVKLYTDSFDDLRAAVNKVPTHKSVTLTVKNKDALDNLSAVGSSISGLSGQLSSLDKQIDAQKDKIAKQGRALAINAQISQLQKQFDSQTGPEGNLSRAAVATLSQINALKAKLASGNYASGGVIRGGARPASSKVDNTMINAQYGEGVVNLKGMAFLGADGLKAINKQQNPFPPIIVNSTTAQNSGTVQVELSSIDRQLLARAGNVTLSIDGKVIAGTANAVNLNGARRGSNG